MAWWVRDCRATDRVGVAGPQECGSILAVRFDAASWGMRTQQRPNQNEDGPLPAVHFPLYGAVVVRIIAR